MGNIKCSVGSNGVNLWSDTTHVQGMLNRAWNASAAMHQDMPEELVVDGKCGQRTIAGIRSFQNRVMKWSMSHCDGRVDPGGKTWKGLNGNIETPVVTVPQPTTPDQWTGTYKAFRQGDYRDHKLGDSNLSMSGYGCALCTLTMAATSVGARTEHWPDALEPRDLTPPLANQIITKGGGFTSGGLLYMSKAAGLLGMKYEEYGFSQSLASSDLNILSGHMSLGLPVAAHVDYKSGDSGDHWILLTIKNMDGTYTAIDPATGRPCNLRPPLEQTENVRYKDREADERIGILVGWPQGGGSANQQQYIVVRFALLSTTIAG